MPVAQEQLFTSTFWSIRRPKAPLTDGHFVIRLNDPSIAFGPDSAADLLRCYGALRRALTELVGATGAQLYISRNWQPVGDAIGEPVAETSTPSLHTFFVWPGSTTAASALVRPAHHRSAVQRTEDVDDGLREWLASNTETKSEPGSEGPLPSDSPAPEGPSVPAESAPEGWENRAFHVEPARAIPGNDFRVGHWTALPRSPVASLDQVDTAALLELVQGIEDIAWHTSPRHAGISVWATDLWGAWPSIEIFAREHGNDDRLASFVEAGGLDLPHPDGAVPAGAVPAENAGTSAKPSPTVEK